jgi:hypothetical protein
VGLDLVKLELLRLQPKSVMYGLIPLMKHFDDVVVGIQIQHICGSKE